MENPLHVGVVINQESTLSCTLALEYLKAM